MMMGTQKLNRAEFLSFSFLNLFTISDFPPFASVNSIWENCASPGIHWLIRFVHNLFTGVFQLISCAQEFVVGAEKFVTLFPVH